ncbi:MAG: hypothetical protein ACOYJQ_12620 [Pseudochelatococcus sp.]|uniref:hypothetical protein n=1 Tax=Pseudochelatococcus sp. TaxID=2020869 RepID=UPI003D8B2887
MHTFGSRSGLLLGAVLAAAAGLILFTADRAGAGATPPQSGPAQGAVDLRDASPDTIRTHILDSCVIREWGISADSIGSYAERCACFARNVTQALSPDEFDAFRRSGVFNASARPKAEAARTACKLR